MTLVHVPALAPALVLLVTDPVLAPVFLLVTSPFPLVAVLVLFLLPALDPDPDHALFPLFPLSPDLLLLWLPCVQPTGSERNSATVTVHSPAEFDDSADAADSTGP